ncbi:hypothetical protein EON65_56345, partial [archaeon]
MLLAADSLEVAQAWVTELEAQIQSLTTSSLSLPVKKVCVYLYVCICALFILYTCICVWYML